MSQTYVFDSFDENSKKSEITRLTKNVESHSKALNEIFLANGLLESQKILDVGCGTGALLNMFADLLPDREYYGVDNSVEILKSASLNGRENIRFVQGEATQLPFEDHTFDFVYTRLVLMHNQDPQYIIREMKRVCKPGGHIIAVEIDDETMVFHPYASEFSKLIRAHIEFSKGKGMDRIMGRKLYRLFKQEEMSETKVIIQTSDYEGPYDDIPFPLRMAMGASEGKHLVENGFITEEERLDLKAKIAAFCNDPFRYYSGSFMYCVGRK